MNIGQNIKRIRKEKGLTQKKLGELCGMNEANIRKYELGGANPKIETIQKIANGLGVPLHELFAYKSLDGSTVIDLTSIEGQDINEYMDAMFKKPFSEHEKEKAKLLQTDTTGKHIVSIHADDVLSLTDEEFKLLLLYNALNTIGQEKAIDHVEMLTKIPEYRKEETE